VVTAHSRNALQWPAPGESDCWIAHRQQHLDSCTASRKCATLQDQQPAGRVAASGSFGATSCLSAFNTLRLRCDTLESPPAQGAALRQTRAFVAAAADARYVALPQATARVAALQAAASALVYDVLMLRVRWFSFCLRLQCSIL
jgi:hypothetical protein